jgi:hypothetical protein
MRNVGISQIWGNEYPSTKIEDVGAEEQLVLEPRGLWELVERSSGVRLYATGGSDQFKIYNYEGSSPS